MTSGKLRTLPLVAVAILLTACNVSLFPDRLPTLSNVNGAVLPEGSVGSTVVLAGGGFGDTQGSGRVLFTPSGGGASLSATITSWADAVILATVPTTTPGAYGVNVQGGDGITSGGRLFTIKAAAPFDASAVTWTAGPALPGAVSGAGVAYAQLGTGGFIYAVGGAGAGGAPVATVSYAAVGTNGTLGAWTATTPLPTALAFSAAVAATQRNSSVTTVTGYLYVLGGATSASGAPVATVYRAPINADGSLGAWTSITALPAPLRSVGAAVQYGSMYVVGGATTANAPVATAYRLPIQVDGGLTPPWKVQGPLPAARARFGFGVLGLYLYVVGGDSAAIAPNDTGPSSKTSTVYFAKLNPSTRDIATSWTTTTALPAPRSAHTAVFGLANVLVTGGVYAGALTHTSEDVYAPINADGTLGAFATAAPAASIFSLCGCNLFNHGAIGYLASNGGFHLVIAGGDNVNALGTVRAETFIY
jgi:hypothetical protein